MRFPTPNSDFPPQVLPTLYTLYYFPTPRHQVLHLLAVHVTKVSQNGSQEGCSWLQL